MFGLKLNKYEYFSLTWSCGSQLQVCEKLVKIELEGLKFSAHGTRMVKYYW